MAQLGKGQALERILHYRSHLRGQVERVALWDPTETIPDNAKRIGCTDSEAYRLARRYQLDYLHPKPSANRQLIRARASAVKTMRKRAGLSYRKIGKIMGVSGATVFNWERKEVGV